MSHSWTVTLEQESDDLYLPLPADMLDQLGWNEGTIIYWIDNKDGTYTLTNKDPHVISS